MATARQKGKHYEIRVYCGVDINGKRLDKSRTWRPDPGMTKKQIEKELERQKMLFEEEIKNGVCPDNNTKFYDFVQRWFDEYGKDNLAVKTYTRYNDHLKNVYPAIGHIKLKDITPTVLNRLYRDLSKEIVTVTKDGQQVSKRRFAPRTINDLHRVIATILNTAVKWELLERNPASRADPPKNTHTEVTYLNEEEVRRMIPLLNDEPIQYRTMIMILLFTGLRRGELCGLEWKDIDFNNKTMRVCRSSQYIGNATVITKEPKTKSGIRQFTLSDSLCQILAQYKLWQCEQRLRLGDRWEQSDRLFTAWNGAPMYPDTITDWFRKFVRKNDFPPVTLHSLRHTNATIMIAEGTDVCTVSRRLGHAQTSTTLNIYAHALQSKDAEVAKKLDNVLSMPSVRYA